MLNLYIEDYFLKARFNIGSVSFYQKIEVITLFPDTETRKDRLK